MLNATTAGSGYDQLLVRTLGTVFALIDDGGLSAVTGTFSGLAEGAQVTIGGNLFTISYKGGDGNDATPTAAKSSYTITVSAGANGSIDHVDEVSVPSGGSKTFTMTPSPGYHLRDVLVDSAPVAAMTTCALWVFCYDDAGAEVSRGAGLGTVTIKNP